MFTLETIRFLAHRREPLDLTISPDPADPTASVMTKSNGKKCRVKDIPNTKELIQFVEHTLRHYPSPVTINGTPLNRTPFPDQATVAVKSFPENDENSSQWEKDSTPPTPGAWHNAFVAGVLCCLTMPRNTDMTTVYHTRGQGGNDFWQKTREVHLSPILVVTDEELEDLTPNDLDTPAMNENNRHLITVKRRARAQVKRTMENEHAPPKLAQPVYRYLLGHTYGTSEPIGPGCPITITGTPVTLPDDWYTNPNMDQPIAATITQALYRANQQFVPAGPYPSTWEHKEAQGPRPRTITSATFTIVPTDTQRDWCIKEASSIEMHLTLEALADVPETVATIPTPFLMEGDDYDIRVTYVRDAVTPQELSEAMLTAYWTQHEYNSWDDMKENFDNANLRMYDLAKAAMNNPEQVFQQQLQRAADHFSTELPAPRTPLKAVSRDGRTTITYDPEPAGVQGPTKETPK